MSSNDLALSIDGLSKSYRIGRLQQKHSTLAESLLDKVRNPRSLLREPTETFWALRDISFDVHQGEVVGIIGRNGAGKSTLLKILSRITEPTDGKVELYGRVGSLLEVGTGFHPELTGRENIYLNGAILGMAKGEIRKHFDAIVEFARIEKFLDTPVKRYSSGMYVRLAFAVAAHLETEIVVVDEVLAVGDAQFQKKCLGKMGEVARAGRTVLLVSHNISVISSLCTRAILLKEGRLAFDGPARAAIDSYMQAAGALDGEVSWESSDPKANNGRFRLMSARIRSQDRIGADVLINEPIEVEFDFEMQQAGLNVSGGIHLFNHQGVWILCGGGRSKRLSLGVYRHTCVIPPNLLNDGRYSISIVLTTDVTNFEIHIRDAIGFDVHELEAREEYLGKINGVIRPNLDWRESALSDPVSLS